MEPRVAKCALPLISRARSAESPAQHRLRISHRQSAQADGLERCTPGAGAQCNPLRHIGRDCVLHARGVCVIAVPKQLPPNALLIVPGCERGLVGNTRDQSDEPERAAQQRRLGAERVTIQLVESPESVLEEDGVLQQLLHGLQGSAFVRSAGNHERAAHPLWARRTAWAELRIASLSVSVSLSVSASLCDRCKKQKSAQKLRKHT